MARIAGIEIPDNKRVDIGLTYIYGIGRSNVRQLIENADVAESKRVKELTEEEVGRIQRSLDQFKTEGELKQEVSQNIRRLEEVGAYRGLRHHRGLPVRGQRTKSNARTRRGKRKTVGTVRKEAAAKTGGGK